MYQIEFNLDRAIRNIHRFNNKNHENRQKEEFIPENLMVGRTYDFFEKSPKNKK